MDISPLHELSIPMSRYTEHMNATYSLASVGDLIGEPARSAILICLLDGRARTAGELAFTANISAQSASGHLSKLIDGGLLTARSSGRHRYFSLAGPEVAFALEALGAIATKARPAATVREHSSDGLNEARSCYDHLAGRIAVELAQKLEDRQIIRSGGTRDYELGKEGWSWFTGFGIDVEPLKRTRRCFARKCVDWTERRPHLAGALGMALYSRLLTLGWVARRRDTRAVRITEAGARQLRAQFGITV